MSSVFQNALLVDDETSIRDIIQEILKMMDIETYCFEDGEQAIEFMKTTSSKIDLMLIDLFLPEISGKEVYEIIAPLSDSAPVIFISGYDEEEAKQKLDLKEGQYFLKKPFTLNTLMQLIKSI